LHQPEPGKTYIAGIDLAGEAESDPDTLLKSLSPRRDSTVITIAELSFTSSIPPPSLGFPISSIPSPLMGEGQGEGVTNPPLPFRLCGKRSGSIPWMANPAIPLSPVMLEASNGEAEASQGGEASPSLVIPAKAGIHSSPSPASLPLIKIVEHYSWTGVKHPDLYPQLVDLLKNVWHCRAVVVDSTGIGEPVASFLKDALGSRIIPFKFTARSKTELGFNLLSAINSGGLKMYSADNSPEYQEFWYQMERAKSYYRPSQTMNFYVDPAEGHDDFLMSLALLVEAASRYQPRSARGR
jgi:hypothetical protein